MRQLLHEANKMLLQPVRGGAADNSEQSANCIVIACSAVCHLRPSKISSRKTVQGLVL